jgi:uncharacterized protein (TIGR03066 family)
MRTRPAFVMICLLFFAAIVAHAESKPDLKKQLLGRWQPAQEQKMQVEFLSNGSFSVFAIGNATAMATGKYKWLDATSIEVTLATEKDKKSDHLQVAIEGDTLSTTDSSGKMEKFTRVK